MVDLKNPSVTFINKIDEENDIYYRLNNMNDRISGWETIEGNFEIISNIVHIQMESKT